jgi:hypothetical protein
LYKKRNFFQATIGLNLTSSKQFNEEKKKQTQNPEAKDDYLSYDLDGFRRTRLNSNKRSQSNSDLNNPNTECQAQGQLDDSLFDDAAKDKYQDKVSWFEWRTCAQL